MDPIHRICEANGIPMAWFGDDCQENLTTLIAAWYDRHLADGGEPDPVLEG